MAKGSPAPAPARVIQAYFPGGRPPARLVTRTYLSPFAPSPAQPPAAALQKKEAARPPHAATLQRKEPAHPATLQRKEPAHPATLQKKDKAHSAAPPHAATLQTKARDPSLLPHAATLQTKDGARSTAQPAAQPAPAVRTRARSAAAIQRDTAMRSGGNVHAFQTPDDFLDQAAARQAKELPSVVRRKMETFFESDFSDVRVHVGPEAPAIGALAFTLGSDIYFAPGQYEPDTMQGQELLGHELTHVVQQRDGRVENPFNTGVAVVQDMSLEDEADRMGRLVAAQPKATAAGYRRELARQGSGGPGTGAQAKRQAAGRAGHAQQKAGGYELVLGAYLHSGEDSKDLPEPLAGHAFVALRDPRGDQEAWGFSPAHYESYDPKRDLGVLKNGVEGRVHEDAQAFEKPGVKTRSYTISESQAEAARAKIAEYRSGKHRYSLGDHTCSAFAADVAGAADIDDASAIRGKPPREVYRKL